MDKEALQMDETKADNLRKAANKKRAIAVERFREGNLAGAKAHAYVASYLCPSLPGLRRFNAILDVMIGYAKKINGSVDWYAVLGAYPTEDIATIRKRYRKLFLDMSMDDDGSLGSTYKAIKILSDSWKFLCNEKGKKLYDKRRQYQLRLNYRRYKRMATTPVILTPVKPTMSYRLMVQLPLVQPPLVQPPLVVAGGEKKRKEPPSKDVSHVKKPRKTKRGNPVITPENAPQGCLEALKAFTKEEMESSKNLVKTSKTKAVVGSKKNVASGDDEAMKNRGMGSNKDTHV